MGFTNHREILGSSPPRQSERIPPRSGWLKGEQGSHLSEGVAVIATPVPACCLEVRWPGRPSGPSRLIWSVSMGRQEASSWVLQQRYRDVDHSPFCCSPHSVVFPPRSARPNRLSETNTSHLPTSQLRK